MLDLLEQEKRRTTTDLVFEKLHGEISSLAILPGAKLSESDIALRFGVSRQPVRDAFNRLEHLDLLLIRPQRATEVRGFSMKRVAHARFTRLGVELEVIRRACLVWDEARAKVLEQNLERQENALVNGHSDLFHALDYEFHKLICNQAGCPMAFDTIEECKKKVDRLCVLSLDGEHETATVFDDHQQIAKALKKRAVEDATAIARQHFARLDDVIEEVHNNHLEYFE